VYIQAGGEDPQWPEPVESDWCGEWQPTGETPPVKRCPHLLDTFDANRLINASSRQVKKWAKDGILPSFQLPDGEFRFLEADLAEWIEKHRQPTEPTRD
jgi:hypothetical protein